LISKINFIHLIKQKDKIMTIKVIRNAYYVNEDLTGLGLVDQSTFECSFSHLLVVGDVWEKIDVEGNFSDDVFKCIEGEWKGEESEGWWDYKDMEGYFEIIDTQ
jgi:hypothetical protein